MTKNMDSKNTTSRNSYGSEHVSRTQNTTGKSRTSGKYSSRATDHSSDRMKSDELYDDEYDETDEY